MSLDLSQFCAVISHELRTPVSVLQGYIRMLQHERSADHPDRAILAEMLEAVDKVAVISRQASDLGRCLRDSGPGASHPPVTMATLAEALSRASGPHQVIATAGGGSHTPLAGHISLAAIVSAIVSVADAVARDAGASSSTVTIGGAHDRKACVIGIASTPSPVFARHRGSARPLGEPAWFASGGLGLALVAAGCIFDALGATVTPSGPDAVMHVHLPFAPGAA